MKVKNLSHTSLTNSRTSSFIAPVGPPQNQGRTIQRNKPTKFLYFPLNFTVNLNCPKKIK